MWRRPVLGALTGAWLLVVAVLTLSPSGYTPPLTPQSFVCIACTSRGTADIILNWLMFLPGGLLMTLLLDGRRAALAAVCLTVLIEIVQIGIPGRAPALQDLVFDTAGAFCGILAARPGTWMRVRMPLALLAVVAWLSPVVLLIPMTSDAELYGLWTPEFADAEVYQGRILAATLGGVPIPSGALSDESEVDAAIVQRRPLEITLRVGPPPTRPSPVFQIVDVRQRTVVGLLALGEDLLLIGRTPSAILRLDQPAAARWFRAAEGIDAGDTTIIVLERGRGSVCGTVGERSECDLAPSLGDGWGHLLYPESASPWLLGLISLGWSLSLGLLLGAGAPSARVAAMRGVSLAVVGLIASAWSPDVRTDFLHALLLGAGSVLGWLAVDELRNRFGRAGG